MDKSLQTIAIVAVPGVALVVMIWAGWHAVVRPPVIPEQDCTVGHLPQGQYQLELVATDGARTGSKSSGTMTLRCASPEDVSLDGRRTPDRDCNRGVHFYGFSDLDFEVVDAPVFRAPPLPTSEDPVWAGVVGLANAAEDRVIGFVIGTVLNRRDDCLAQGGDGIFLGVRDVRPDLSSGLWASMGDIRGGNGTFTMRYIGPE